MADLTETPVLTETEENGAPLGAALAEFAQKNSPETAEALLSEKPKSPLSATDKPAEPEDGPTGAPTAEEAEAKAKADADKQVAEAAAAAGTDDAAKAKAESDAASARAEKHADLDKIVAAGEANMRPKTRKQFDAIKAETIKARDAAEKAATDLAAAQAALAEAEKKAGTNVVPESVTKELESLREKVRELDITQDPEIRSKFDSKITANVDSTVALLADLGVGKIKNADGSLVPDPSSTVLATIKKEGLTFKALQPYIDGLRKAGEHDAAEKISDAIKENQRLARDKDTEISAFKANYEARTSERTKQSQAQVTAHAQRIQQETSRLLQETSADLKKRFSFMNRPEEPKATDTPAVTKAKQQAVAEFDAAKAAVDAAIKEYSIPDGTAPEKVALIQGKTAAAIIEGITLKNHIVPRLERELSAEKSRRETVEAELARFKKGGALSRAHSAAATAPSDGAKVAPAEASLTDALAIMARGAGLKIA